MSMVPGGGSVSVREHGYQLYAALRPARSVGGDLYYFQQSADRLHFIIGDVSDKGVPAALFMAKTVTLYTGALGEGLTPGEILAHMNQALSQNNDACMFVTALCGTLDLDSGRLVMANAGHMHPIRKTDAASGELPVDGGIALGLMEDAVYPDIEIELERRTSLLMYTDGISEAFNRQKEAYEEQRLLDLVAEAKDLSAEALGTASLADVENFVGNAVQSDDITLLIIHYGNE
jgi:sigma-B regulation protein RsbU (phosphoserine phosphatase)